MTINKTEDSQKSHQIQPTECLSCTNQPCKQSAPATLDICAYGVSFYNENGFIKKRRENVTLRHIAANLRHELNKVLQFIINEANEIDPNLSLKEIDVQKNAGRIVGATVILDHFIEMISGVYDFAPNRDTKSSSSNKPISLRQTIDRYIGIYSLIKNTRRASLLKFSINVDSKIEIPILGPILEYLIAILSDNLWKYAENESEVNIYVDFKDDSLLDLSFSNVGSILPDDGSIFEKGYKLNPRSEGFGFGLYWAKILCDHYNDVSGRQFDSLSIEHFQKLTGDGDAIHVFSIKNIAYIK